MKPVQPLTAANTIIHQHFGNVPMKAYSENKFQTYISFLNGILRNEKNCIFVLYNMFY